MQTDAQAPGVFNAIWITVTVLFLLGNIVPMRKKCTFRTSLKRTFNISWIVFMSIQFLAALLRVFLVPTAAVSLPALALRATGNEVPGIPSPILLDTRCLHASYPPFPGIQFYKMAAKDKVCGNNLVALKDLRLDLGVWVDRLGDIDCEADQRWIGAPDPTDDLKHWTGFDPCADVIVYPCAEMIFCPEAALPKGMCFSWFIADYINLVVLQCTILTVINFVLDMKDSCIQMRRTSVHPAVAAAVATPVALPVDPTALDYS